jgi:hypothetical protein
MIAAMGRWVTREMRRRPSLGARSNCRTEDDFVRQAVAPKGGAWTVFHEGEPLADQTLANDRGEARERLRVRG